MSTRATGVVGVDEPKWVMGLGWTKSLLSEVKQNSKW